MKHKRLLHEPQRCRRDDGTDRASFRSKAKARQAILRQRGGARYVPPLYPYQCPWCRLWHVTSQEQRNQR